MEYLSSENISPVQFKLPPIRDARQWFHFCFGKSQPQPQVTTEKEHMDLSVPEITSNPTEDNDEDEDHTTAEDKTDIDNGTTGESEDGELPEQSADSNSMTDIATTPTSTENTNATNLAIEPHPPLLNI